MRPPQRRILAASALSLAAHAALLAWLVLGLGPAPRAPDWFEVELRPAVGTPVPPPPVPPLPSPSVPEPPPRAAPAAPVPPGAARQPVATPRGPPPVRAPDRAGTQAEPGTEAAAGGGAPAPGTSPEAWFRQHGLGGSRAGGADLAPRLPSGAGGPGPAPATAQAVVEGILREAAGAARVRTTVHPYWSPLREALAAGFHPGWEVLEAEPTTSAVAAIALLRMWPDYMKVAGRYGQTGAPFGPEERPRNPFEHEYTALVQVEQGGDGAVRSVELKATSGVRALDRQALASCRTAAEHLALGEPPSGLRRSLWAFIATLGVMPPGLFLTCPPDIILRGDLSRCDWPLKKTAESRVELRSLE